LPVFNELKTKGIAPWIDRHDYLYGRTKFLLHEQKYAEEMRILIQQSTSIARHVDEPGLFERVTSMQPEAIIP